MLRLNPSNNANIKITHGTNLDIKLDQEWENLCRIL